MPPRKRAGDLTGLETQRLIVENAEELKKVAAHMSIMADIEAEQSKTPVDYSDGPITKVSDLEVEEVKLEAPTRKIVTNTTLEQMTFGAGNHYTFEEGRPYIVPAELARHLESKGLLWEGGYR